MRKHMVLHSQMPCFLNPHYHLVHIKKIIHDISVRKEHISLNRTTKGSNLHPTFEFDIF